MHDREFQAANQVLVGSLAKNKKEGKDQTKHKLPIESDDLSHLYELKVLSNETPITLQRKVYVEISLHFGRRGREGLRQLNKESFEIKVDRNKEEYVIQSYHEKEKNHKGYEAKKHFEKSPVMYSTGSPLCPVYSLKLYLSKLHPDCKDFFQLPNRNFQRDGIWYRPRPLGVNTLGDMMKNICLEGNLDTIYTNHCIRATTCTALHERGVVGDNIRHVTGHRNADSLKSYIQVN